MLHDQSWGKLIPNLADAKLVPVKVSSRAYEQHLHQINGAPFKYRAPHANRPTPPRKKWVWGIQAIAP